MRVLPAPDNCTALHPASDGPPSVKLTGPVGERPVTVAVSVRLAPNGDEGAEVPSVVVVVVMTTPACAEATAAAASMMPEPQMAVVQVHDVLLGGFEHAGADAGNARAVLRIFDSTCAGVSAGLIDSISDTTPDTCGVAMLVPA